MLESRGIGVESSPIGCEGFMKASKVQGSSLLLSNADNFVGYSYIYIYVYILHYIVIDRRWMVDETVPEFFQRSAI